MLPFIRHNGSHERLFDKRLTDCAWFFGCDNSVLNLDNDFRECCCMCCSKPNPSLSVCRTLSRLTGSLLSHRRIDAHQLSASLNCSQRVTPTQTEIRPNSRTFERFDIVNWEWLGCCEIFFFFFWLSEMWNALFVISQTYFHEVPLCYARLYDLG